MGLRLSSVGVGYIAGGIIAFVGIGAYTAYESVNHALNYQEVSARVTSIEPQCARGVDHPDYSGKIEWGACGDLAAAPSDHLKSVRMERQTKVAFTFGSPADGQEHEGFFLAKGRTLTDSAAKLFPGKTGLIWASTSDPDDYHYDAWPFAQNAV